ncbi:hypothetical protein LPJ79_005688 [Coemansia sp. RSA 1821]|nr:hypothetical protein LPJ79_005688 [Coemansia sp. RSA 1821]KAJ2672116.1 hypothetical protein IWW42_003021 [Coemansia sp. RSA 1085]
MSAQQNLGAGGDWRSAITEQARNQHLWKQAANVLQGLNEQQREVVMKLVYQTEVQAFTSASSAQEYVFMLNSQLEALSQKIKAMLGNTSAVNNTMGQSGAAVNPAVSTLQSTQMSQTPMMAHAQPQQQQQQAQQPQAQPQQQQQQQQMAPQQMSGAAQANLQQLLPKIREVVQSPESSTIADLTMSIQVLQAQANANPNARQGILEAVKKLIFELQKRQTQVQAAMRQQQTQQQQQTPQQQQQTPQQIPGTLPTTANGMFPQASQFPNQQQLMQMRLQGQQSQAQFQALQAQPQLAAALATAAQQRQPTATTVSASNLTPEETQGWIALLRRITRPFTYNGTQVQLTLPHAHRVMSHFRQQGDKQAEASLLNTINEILTACKEEAKKPIPQEVMQMLLQDLTAHSNMPQAAAAVSGGIQPSASSMAGAAVPVTTAATTSVAKKQPSGKNSPAAKGKKKSQSPRAPAKPRKSSPPKPSITSTAHNAQAPALAAAGQPAAASVQTQPTQQQQQQMPSISTDTANRIVADIAASLDPAMVKRHEHIALEEKDKKIVRGHMMVLDQLVKMSSRLLPVVYMRTRNREVVVKALTIQMLVTEQLRIIKEDKFIIRPQNVVSLTDYLKGIIEVSKEWGNMQTNAQEKPPQQRAAETPLTNMHPDAVTSDPALENFQKAVKHPLDPGNLKLPAAKKRVMAKSSSVGSSSTAASAQAQSAVFAPAPLMLPPNMTREEFERLPLETRMAILKDQQSEKIRKHTSGISPVATMSAQAANPLLAAVMQGSQGAVSAESAEMEQQLQALEKDKWNKPLEYMMCVLGQFSKSAEKAGMEPAPILQQAFWPIAQKTMSNNWGAISTDAVL